MKVSVIIPAAGLGTRMAAAARDKKPAASKQFTDLAGTPILIHTLRKFIAAPQVSEIWIALRKQEMGEFRDRLRSDGNDAPQKKVELVE